MIMKILKNLKKYQKIKTWFSLTLIDFKNMKNWFYFRDVLAQMVSTFDVRVHVIRLVLLEDQQEAFSLQLRLSPLHY